MLKKRFMIIFLAVLSFFVLTIGQTFAKTEYVLPGEVLSRRLSIYMNNEKVEPVGGIVEGKINVVGGTKEEALKLYDENVSSVPYFEEDTSVVLDMGVNIIFSKIRYYTGKITESNNNSFGTRFYASKDNKTFTELTVVQGTKQEENCWNEVEFSGLGEFRFFRVDLPAKSNISEIEWMGTSGYSKIKQQDGKSAVKLSLCGYNEGKDLTATVLACVINKNGVLKQGKALKQTFTAKGETEFDILFENTFEEDGDKYRVVVLDKNGSMAIPSVLNFRLNDASSEFSVASVFSDNMMLQAEQPLTVWGKAPKNSTVEVILKNSLGGEIVKYAKTGVNSNWEANLGTFSAGGKYELTVKADGKSAIYKNITFGDVWLCTGQSNMDYYMMSGDDSAADLKKAADVKNSNIRIYNLWNKGTDGAAAPVENPPNDGVIWREADTDTVAYCSAVGYYFARKLQAETNNPIGIINVAVGDTEINRWVKKGYSNGKFTSTDGNLYNNRIYPFERLKIKGIILYQGEADQYRTHMTALEYRDALTGLIDSYRSKWGRDLPFYWAQLTRYKVDESLVRQGQFLTLDTVAVKKNTGMVVLTDVFGNYEGKTGSCREDIHPWNKKIVGERFAAYALRDCYGADVCVSGPMYESSQQSDNKLILSFNCTGSLRIMPKDSYADKITSQKIKDGAINANKIMEFEIAGQDGIFYDADAKAEGNKVILTSKSVSKPIYARYAWGEYPEAPNLTDDTGLPAAAFTTENLD